VVLDPPPVYRAPGRSVPYLPGFRGRIDRMLGRSPCALRVLSRRVRRMTPKRQKRRGEPVPSPDQDKAEVVRAVLTRREIGVVLSAAAEPARDHRHVILLLWPGGCNPTATRFYSAGGSRCGTHPWRRHRQRGIR